MALPIDEHGFYLQKTAFCDANCLRMDGCLSSCLISALVEASSVWSMH